MLAKQSRKTRRTLSLALAGTLLLGVVAAPSLAEEISEPLSTSSVTPELNELTNDSSRSPTAEPTTAPADIETDVPVGETSDALEPEWVVDAHEENDSGDAAVGGSVDVSPSSIPAPTSNTAVIHVKVGGDRQPDGAVKGLAGVRLALHSAGGTTGGAGSSGAGSVPTQGANGTRYNSAWSWTTCISDADGDCSLVIPIRPGAISFTGVPQDTRFWIVQESVPDGWYSNPTVRVGGFGASPEKLWHYRFKTDIYLSAGRSYSSTTAMPWNTAAASPDRYFMRNRIDSNTEDWYAANVGRTTGVWNSSRNNPAVPQTCSLKIALVVDTSGSLGAGGMNSMKTLISDFVDSFVGTATSMALFSYSDISPGSGASNHPTLLPVGTPAQAAAFKNQYAGWTAGGGTNWDRGFTEAANASASYDLVINLTDGNPTVIRNNPGSGSSAYNSIQDVDAGIFSANQVKAQGTSVLAVGIGAALTSNSKANLRAISGPVEGKDFVLAANFMEATKFLNDLANRSCDATVSVQKMIIPSGGTFEDAKAAPEGWEFSATSHNSEVTVKAPNSKKTSSTSNGTVDFGLDLAKPSSSGNVSLVETQQEGYELVPVGEGPNARNGVCLNTTTDTSVPVVNVNSETHPGVQVPVSAAGHVHCYIYNRQLAQGELVVEKNSTPTSGTVLTVGDEVTYELTFTNSGEMPVGVDYEDLLVDVLDDATLVGSPTAQQPLKAVFHPTAQMLAITGTLQGGQSVKVTYTVKVNDKIESSSGAFLRNYVVESGEDPPETCEPEEPCTVHPVKVNLSWNKVNLTGDLLAGSQWTLTPLDSNGTPITGDALDVSDCEADSAGDCTAMDKDPAAGKFLIMDLTPGRYELAEVKAPAGYQLLTEVITITVDSNVEFGDIENDQVEIPSIPLTGGTGTGTYLLGATILVALAGVALLYQRKMSAQAK